ncbi:MAG: ribonuclease D [Defluviicoccus sp.]|nr:ribonuclease D [Defluviicoccus sp.]MDE0384260.1 ribonuclease D [Defluviicoccus sp.]
MHLIADTGSLRALCERLAASRYVTVDTEFLRDTTYWPRLCLVQLASLDEAAAVDALAPGIDLAPLLALLRNAAVLKVFHAARQDIEIFFHLDGSVPEPVFDTQIAAMVCGFGDQASYERLVAKLARASIDKTQRFTDWSRRPLSRKMYDYAISDVTHLRAVYEKLAARLERDGRAGWLAEEMASLTDPATYRLDPAEAWLRVKTRLGKPRQLAVLRDLAAWREAEAQRRDVPRNRVLRDEALNDIAAQQPASREELWNLRSLGRGHIGKAAADALLEVVAVAKAAPASTWPEPRKPRPQANHAAPAADLLKVLLKLRCEENGVAQKLVASADDIEAIARDDSAEVRALKGWRREIFGRDALALKHGEIALAMKGGGIRVIAGAG